ncbi:hypothetical protein K501DRAFT_275772 [Backusella circina FSU 941]|nr:hypothetical protein K501DRAFT_275772 [Backusella circina FSU 941]
MATDPSSISSSSHQTVDTNNTSRMHSPNNQRQRTPATTASAESLASNGYRPLNVKDALTYLDQVKVKFADQPEVYNRFLDIMKEFKSQAIDTPGVIKRVSTLFRGHPALIFGFNTFLPPGYRIECSTDDHARDIIRVTTPTGTTTTSTSEPMLNLPEASSPVADQQQPRYYQPYPTTPNTAYRHSPTAPGEPMLNIQEAADQHQQPRFYQPYPTTPTTAYRNSPTGPLPSISSYHPSMHHAAAPPPPPPSSSHHPPSTPPSHLPTSRGTVDESATRRAPVEFNHAINYVNKIKNRFSSDPETYKQFLEILQTYQKEQKPIQEVYAQVQILFNGANDLLAEFKQFLPDTSSSSSTSINEKKRASTGNPKPAKRAKTKDAISDIRASLLPITPEEHDFFERIRQHTTHYQEFVRLLALYSQQIMDGNALVDQCEPIIKEPDLVQMLKRMVGYKVQDQVIENIPSSESDVQQQEAMIKCKQYGPSYRVAPASWKAPQCSGRDSLCDQVLNDDFVSRPNYDHRHHSSRKINRYEEAMHRVEDERLEYDSFIDANIHTIGLLEPVSQQLANLNEEDKTTFRLPPGFGPSKVVYQRIIRQVYGEVKGNAVVEKLHECPAQVIPTLLHRLKERDKKWKQGQRECNRVWREIEIKNYYRSLDYQGVHFKVDDRKRLVAKSLVTEIEELHADHPTSPQLHFEFKDRTLFKDVTRILFSYLERRGGQKDDELIKAFIEMFLPVLFDVPDVLPTEDNELEEEEEEEEEDEIQSQHSYDSDISTGLSRRGRSRHNNDDEKPLLKDVLTRSIKNLVSSEENNEDETEEEEEEEEEDGDDEEEKKKKGEKEEIQVPDVTPQETMIVEEEEEPKEQKFHRFFGNTAFYCFFRLLQIAYERLGFFKSLDESKQLNKTELNLISKTMYSVNIDVKSGYYKPLLKLVDRFFDGDIDQDEYEECARYIYGNQVYLLFTIDKLMASIINQNHQHETNTPELTKAYRKEVSDILNTNDDDLYSITFDTLNRILSIQILAEDDEAFEFDQDT